MLIVLISRDWGLTEETQTKAQLTYRCD